ncbi:peptide deformylase [Mycoplasma phocimorsus]|uniref:Peptide deformylase n=1 Tax=Mycoplasma phocimorsus TaxID=3045839 RepID=A0AAJ1PQW9_9MOLU|nr:peptide deformylase [Mycoplasma phocimorsus]MDJ1645694.1 peptide deformylase [Mycoplasma phocimorsus]MDJ1646514.1 peptide deformylase [Mycoplasma phocimorsus]MDJ1646925.1 peptide deformylase [Mycoplasma phocimorsus]
MFKVKLVELPEKILREKSKDVPLPLSVEDIELAEKMIWHVTDSQKEGSQFRAAVGVAAIQYGIPKKMFYFRVPDNDGKIIVEDLMINPYFEAYSDYKLALNTGEGCLSVNEKWPNQEGYIYRPARVILKGYSYLTKKDVTHDLSGYAAIVAGHEMDHLNGMLFIDRINRKDPFYKPKNSELI